MERLCVLFSSRGERANRMIWERIEVDEMMSWLSTLGGAFSALGDYKLECVGEINRTRKYFYLTVSVLLG